MTMNEYKCARCGDSVFTPDTIDKDELGLLLCDECRQFEEDLDNLVDFLVSVGLYAPPSKKEEKHEN